MSRLARAGTASDAPTADAGGQPPHEQHDPPSRNVKCTVLGHKIRFHADDRTMTWSCQRCSGQSGAKTYESAAAARRFARAFNYRDSEDVGARAPYLGMFPLRLWHYFRGKKGHAV